MTISEAIFKGLISTKWTKDEVLKVWPVNKGFLCDFKETAGEPIAYIYSDSGQTLRLLMNSGRCF
ncbi:MAG: hypothetical protein QMC67_05360 [Candidatus Wallbacteria bacterium]